MRQDPYERTNLAAAHPEIVSRLEALLQEQRQAGRTAALR
jgi:hypothetical protein